MGLRGSIPERRKEKIDLPREDGRFGNSSRAPHIVTTHASLVSILMMNNSSQKAVNISVRISTVAFLVAITGVLAIFARSVEAQQNAAPTIAVSSTLAKPVDSTTPAAATEKAPAADYKSSLNTLSTLYQNEVQRLEKQNGQAKDLFTQGLISRVEMEKNDKELADARAKVEEIAKQIADANKPPPAIVANDPSLQLVASNQVWSTGNSRIDGLIRLYGNQYNVDPYLIYCLMSQESKFTSGALSPKGAQGLMQLMPGTAARYGVTNPYDQAQSIMGGTRYLKDLLKMFNGRVDLALAGYNAGENAVIKYGYTVPPYDETRNYVKLIIKRYGKTQTGKS
jgi:soluble lytic murein transglycosylase-like protein